MSCCKNFLADETAATAVEYAVMLAMILMTLIATISTFGGEISSLFGRTKSELESH